MAQAEQVKQEEAPSTNEIGAAVGAAIAKGIREGLAALLPPKKMTQGEYNRKYGKKVHFTPNREYYQNGFKLEEHQVPDDCIEQLNKIYRPGHYIHRRVEVIIQNEGSPVEIVILRYNDKSIDQRMENARHWSGFYDLVHKIVLEQEVGEENDKFAEEVAEEKIRQRRVRQQAAAKA